LKNIYAICCGIAHAKNSWRECFGFYCDKKHGGDESDLLLQRELILLHFLGLAGMGDLMATCTSKLIKKLSARGVD
jgi:hypothetical protein